MKNRHPQLKRPRMYFTLGFGWSGSRWYEQGLQDYSLEEFAEQYGPADPQ